LEKVVQAMGCSGSGSAEGTRFAKMLLSAEASWIGPGWQQGFGCLIHRPGEKTGHFSTKGETSTIKFLSFV